MVKRRQILSILFTLLITASPAFAGSVQWAFSFNNVAGTWSASTAGNLQTVSGTMTRPSTGFVRMVVTAASGDNTPAISTIKYAIEVPGLSFISEPILLNELQLIYAVAAGQCPTRSFNSTFVFGQWDTANDLTSNSQPAFGTASYNLGTGAFTLTNVYNVNNNTPVPAFSSFSMDASSCATGFATIPGAGDRGGKLYFAVNGASVLRTNGNKAVIGLPQVKIPGRHELNGNYAVYRYDAASISQITPMRMVVSDLGATGASEKLSDPNAGTFDGSFQETLTVNAINTPVNGMFTGTVVNGATNGKVTCAVYFTQQNLIFCAGQSPDLNSKPFNLMLVADVPQFTRAGAVDQEIRSYLKIPDGSGDYYISGYFGSVGGVDSHGIARVNSDLTRDASFTVEGRGFDDIVTSVKFAPDGSGDIYCAGNFREYGTHNVYYLARLHSDGTFDASFNQGGGFDGRVWDIQPIASTNDVYAVGSFFEYNTHSINHIVRLNSDATIDTGFDYGTGFTGEGGDYANSPFDSYDRGPRRIYKDPASDKVYVVGEFTEYRGITVNNIIRINTDGTRDAAFATGTGFDAATSFLTFITGGGGDMLVGGPFTSFKGNVGQPNMELTRITSSGALNTSFSFDPNDTSIEPEDAVEDGTGKFYFVGAYGGSFARLNSNGTWDGSFGDAWGKADNKAYTVIPLAGGNSLWLGQTTIYDGFPAQRAVKLDSSAVRDMNWRQTNEGLNWGVQKIVGANTPDGDIYILGYFHAFSGINQYEVARINSNGTLDLEFDNENGDFDGGTNTISVKSDGSLWVAGWFYNHAGNGKHLITRLSFDGSNDATLSNVGAGFPYGIQVSASIPDPTNGTKLIAAGDFFEYQGVTVNHIVRILADGTIDTTFNMGTGFDDSVYAVAAATDGSGDIYAGGPFTTYNNASSRALVRINSDGSRDATFNIGTGMDNGIWTDIHVTAIAIAKDGSNDVYVAGEVRGCNGVSGPEGIVRLNSDGTLDTGFAGSGLGNGLWSLTSIETSYDGGVYVGGVRITEWDGHDYGTAVNLIKALPNGARDTSFNVGTGFNSQVSTIYAPNDSTGKVYVGGDFSTYNGTGAAYLARLRSDGTID